VTLAVLASPALTYRYLETEVQTSARQAAPALPPLSSHERSSFAAARSRRSFAVLGYGGGSISVVGFATHLRMLSVAGYHSVNARQVVDALDGRHPLPGRAVLIAFDGAHPRTWTHADPVLARYGFSAAVFVDPAEVGRRRYLTWNELFTMGRSGRWSVEVGMAPGRLLPDGAESGYLRRIGGVLGRARAAVVDHGLPMPLLFSYPFPAARFAGLMDVVNRFFQAGVASDSRAARRVLPRSVVAAGITDRTLSLQLGAPSGPSGEIR
jgi:hypothetical protein